MKNWHIAQFLYLLYNIRVNMGGIPISPEALPITSASTEVAAVTANTAAETAAFAKSMPIAGAAKEAASMGAVAPSILGTIAGTAFLIGGLVFVGKGMQAVVTGKNPFKKTV
jgi:hypothetical protein